MDEFHAPHSDESLALVKPQYWAILGGFLILLLSFLAYIFLGTIPIRVEGEGKLVSSIRMAGKLSPAELVRLRVGMTAEVAFDVADAHLYGRVIGRVFSIANDQIVIDLDEDPTTASGYRWTSKQGPPFEIPLGSSGAFEVTIEQRKPISYLLP